MQSKQRRDKEKCEVIGEDDKLISLMTCVDSWRDKAESDAAGALSQRNVAINTTKNVNRHQKCGYQGYLRR